MQIKSLRIKPHRSWPICLIGIEPAHLDAFANEMTDNEAAEQLNSARVYLNNSMSDSK